MRLEAYENELEAEPRIGFATTTSADNGRSRRHEHSFHQVEPKCIYPKNNDASLYYAMLFCECGETKEIVAERRT